jgi:hypothetical protein
VELSPDAVDDEDVALVLVLSGVAAFALIVPASTPPAIAPAASRPAAPPSRFARPRIVLEFSTVPPSSRSPL